MAFLVPLIPYIASAGAAVGQGVSQNQAAQYNATIATQNARTSLDESNERQEMFWRNTRQVFGAQRAAIGEAGIGFSGTAADIQNQSMLNAEHDAMAIQYEGDFKARNFQANSELDRYSGQTAQDQSYFKAAASAYRGYGQTNYGK